MRRRGSKERAVNVPLRGLDQVKWEQYAQPTENAVDAVPSAIRALADGSDGDRQRAYNRMLYALGNNHAGTYFPVVLPAIPFLREILRGPALVARLRTLDVLIDLVGSFGPDLEHEEVDSTKGRRSLKTMVQEEAAGLASDVERLHRDPGSNEEARLARELLELLRE